MNNAPTPETDALARAGAYMKDGDYSSTQSKQFVHIDDARKLERERDAARANSWTRLGYGNLIAERDQLRKVCDELAQQYRYEMMSMFGHASDCDCSRCEPMVKLYNTLPHVIAKKGNNAI